MGKFLLFFAVGVGAALLIDRKWGTPVVTGATVSGIHGLGQSHPGFIPLETPRSTLVNVSASSLNAARLAYLSSGRQGLGEIDYFLT